MLENYLGCFLLLAEWLQKTRYSSNDQLNPETLAQVEDLIKRFDVDLSGRIEFGNGEFLGVIASIAVTSVQDIDDFVFSAAFRTFDHVSVLHKGRSPYHVYSTYSRPQTSLLAPIRTLYGIMMCNFFAGC